MMFDPQPSLSGTLLEVRPLQESDYNALFDVASDPLIWEQHPEPDRYRLDVFQAFFQESIASGGALIIHDAQSQEVIGSSRFYGFDEKQSEVEIGWTFLARSHWGGRYNRELKRLMLDHAFRFVGSAIFYIGPANIRSQHATLKVGGIREPNRDEPGRLFYRISRPHQ